MSFYNTINAKGAQLDAFESIANTQEQKVIEVFRKHNKVSFAWFEIQNILSDIPEISIKRAITNLKTKGKLFKTSDMVTGSYGKPCHKYQLL